MDAIVQVAKSASFAAQSYTFISSFTSPNTRRAYRRDILAFATYWRERGVEFDHPGDIGADHLIAYRDWLMAQPYRRGTVHRKLVPLRSLINFCWQLGIVDRNPLAVVKLPSPDPERPTPAYSDEHVRQILALPKRDRPIGRMHYAILCVLFYVGLRRQELVSLQVKDLGQDKHHRTLTIRHGKGGKTRKVPLHPVVQSAIDEYLAGSGRELDPEQPLFIAAKRSSARSPGRPLSTNTVYSTVKAHVARAGIGIPGMPHACRATLVSHLLDGRASLHEVAALVGHASITTTTMYDRRRKALDKSAAYGVNYG